MKHILLILLFAALLAVASCSRTDDARLAVAERQMAEHPDSALLTLRQIDATSLNRHNTALYALLLTQAQYKNDITATSDSLINIALDYFSDGKRHIECLIYKGAVLQELGEEQEAIDYLKKAEAATSPTDNEMLGYINMRLGNIYMNSYIENNEDIAKYKKALHYYKLSGNKKYQLACLGTVGALYRAENMDSAYYYINAAIKLAEELGNSERIAYHKGLLVRAYITDSLIYKAKNAATCLMAEYPEYCDNDLLLDASRIYAMLGNRDSAFFYLQKASKLNLSEPEEIVLLDAKYNIFMADKNYKAALNIVKEKNELATNTTFFTILMKKLIITCLSKLSTMTIWAMDETVKIQIRPTKQGDKTETHIPEVDYDKEKNKLDVSFRSDGNYDVIIDDEDGETRCRFGLNTSGAKQQYALPNLQEGVYTVTISSGINEFSGELYVDDDF